MIMLELNQNDDSEGSADDQSQPARQRRLLVLQWHASPRH